MIVFLIPEDLHNYSFGGSNRISITVVSCMEIVDLFSLQLGQERVINAFDWIQLQVFSISAQSVVYMSQFLTPSIASLMASALYQKWGRGDG